MATEQTILTVDTLIVVRELFDGTESCYPVADPSLVSHTPGGAGLSEQRLFLEGFCSTQPPWRGLRASSAVSSFTRQRSEEYGVQTELPADHQPTLANAGPDLAGREGP